MSCETIYKVTDKINRSALSYWLPQQFLTEYKQGAWIGSPYPNSKVMGFTNLAAAQDFTIANCDLDDFILWKAKAKNVRKCTLCTDVGSPRDMRTLWDMFDKHPIEEITKNLDSYRLFNYHETDSSYRFGSYMAYAILADEIMLLKPLWQ